jgi:hypothetical protein
MSQGYTIVNGKKVEGRTLSFDMESGTVSVENGSDKIKSEGINDKGEKYFDTQYGRVTICKTQEEKKEEVVEYVKKNALPLSIGALIGAVAVGSIVYCLFGGKNKE